MDDLSKTTKDQLIAAIELAEARLQEIRSWSLSRQMARMNELKARLLELEAWEAEPNLIHNERYTGL